MSDPATRVFARWRRETPTDPGYSQVPEDGFCLSVFVLVLDPVDLHRVALGHVDPTADWARLGSLQGDRLRKTADRWMLPSSHLLEFEGPNEAARRIVTEQLERPDLPLDPPEVVSDVYRRPGATAPHWDLDFLVRTRWPEGVPLAARPWRDLEFVDPARLSPSDVARSHDDVLRFAGWLVGR
jgi:hypothetical protein